MHFRLGVESDTDNIDRGSVTLLCLLHNGGTGFAENIMAEKHTARVYYEMLDQVRHKNFKF